MGVCLRRDRFHAVHVARFFGGRTGGLRRGIPRAGAPLRGDYVAPHGLEWLLPLFKRRAAFFSETPAESRRRAQKPDPTSFTTSPSEAVGRLPRARRGPALLPSCRSNIGAASAPDGRRAADKRRSSPRAGARWAPLASPGPARRPVRARLLWSRRDRQCSPDD